jgi:hypothetical protein
MWFPDDIPVKQAKNVLDNKVVLMGSFVSYGGVPPDPAHGMMRIKPDGTFDPDFSVGDGARWVVTPETEFRHPSVDNLEVGLNDKLLLTGTFEKFNNTLASGIINLNPDGTVDHDFVAPVNHEIYDYQSAYLKRQPDGSFYRADRTALVTDFRPRFPVAASAQCDAAGDGRNCRSGQLRRADDVTVISTLSATPGDQRRPIDPNGP